MGLARKQQQRHAAVCTSHPPTHPATFRAGWLPFKSSLHWTVLNLHQEYLPQAGFHSALHNTPHSLDNWHVLPFWSAHLPFYHSLTGNILYLQSWIFLSSWRRLTASAAAATKPCACMPSPGFDPFCACVAHRGSIHWAFHNMQLHASATQDVQRRVMSVHLALRSLPLCVSWRPLAFRWHCAELTPPRNYLLSTAGTPDTDGRF